MKRNLFSLIVSLVFIPIALIAQAVGHYIGFGIYWFIDNFSFLGLPQNVIDHGPYYVGGLMAGYFSALICKKSYKKFNFKYTIIIPSIIIFIAILGSVIGNREEIFFTISRDVITILSFIYFLRNES
jgi:hypothetical protein